VGVDGADGNQLRCAGLRGACDTQRRGGHRSTRLVQHEQLPVSDGEANRRTVGTGNCGLVTTPDASYPARKALVGGRR
jgi:hypothetical protein